MPKPQRKKLIKSFHDGWFFKPLTRIKEYFYWPKMRHNVLKYLRTCFTSGAEKPVNTASMGLMGNENIRN